MRASAHGKSGSAWNHVPRPEPGAELTEEREVEVDLAVGRAVERPGRSRACPHLVGVLPSKTMVSASS
jgi:hypothetical protein